MPEEDLDEDDSQPGSLLAARQSGLSQSLPELDRAWWTKVEKHRPSRVKKVSFVLFGRGLQVKSMGFLNQLVLRSEDTTIWVQLMKDVMQ